MNTKVLEYIIAISKEHSISRAADQFYLTQPVLSRHLKKIEKKIGTPLFVRQKEGMVLTEAGRIYINGAQNILHLESELENDLQTMLAEKKNTLRIYIDYPYAKQLSERILPPFHKEHPNVQVHIFYESADKIQSILASGEKGIGILISSGKRLAGLEYVLLHSDALAVINPENKRNTDTIFMHQAGTGLRAMEEQWLAQNSVAFHTVLEAPSFQTGLAAVCADQGCAFVLQSMANDTGLQLYSRIPPLPFEVFVVYPQNMVFRPASQALLQVILQAS